LKNRSGKINQIKKTIPFTKNKNKKLKNNDDDDDSDAQNSLRRTTCGIAKSTREKAREKGEEDESEGATERRRRRRRERPQRGAKDASNRPLLP